MPIQRYARRVGSIGRVRHKNGSTRKALQTRGICRTFRVGFQRHQDYRKPRHWSIEASAARGSASDASARPRFLAIRAAPETSDVTGGAE